VTGVYTYVCKTTKDKAGQCGTLSLNLNEGSLHTVLVKFKYPPPTVISRPVTGPAVMSREIGDSSAYGHR
jgi:hypothetical protein